MRVSAHDLRMNICTDAFVHTQIIAFKAMKSSKKSKEVLLCLNWSTQAEREREINLKFLDGSNLFCQYPSQFLA